MLTNNQQHPPRGTLEGHDVRPKPPTSNFRDEREGELRRPPAPVGACAAGSQGLTVRNGVWWYSVPFHL